MRNRAKDINLTTLNIEFWRLIFFSKKLKLLVSPLLSLDYRRTATVGSYWRGMGEAYF